MKLIYYTILPSLSAMMCFFGGCATPQIQTPPQRGATIAVDYMLCAYGSVTAKGIPLEGVEVSLYLPGDQAPRQETTTDSDGHYVFGLCCSGPDTPYILKFAKLGFKPSSLEGTSDCSLPREIQLTPEN